MNFLPHLEELRKRAVLCLAAFLMASIGAYFFSHRLLEFSTWPLRLYSQAPLVFQKPYDAFVIHLKAAAFSGLILSSPVWVMQLWRFGAPGLYEKEKKIFMPVFAASLVLFVTGVLFAYFFVIPWGLGVLLSFQTESLKPLLTADAYFSFLSGMLLAFGILFEFPVVIVGVSELGMVRTQTLAEARRAIIVSIFFIAAILTPSPDPISQISLALPLWGLFEISLLIAGKREKARDSKKGTGADLTLHLG